MRESSKVYLQQVGASAQKFPHRLHAFASVDSAVLEEVEVSFQILYLELCCILCILQLYASVTCPCVIDDLLPMSGFLLMSSREAFWPLFAEVNSLSHTLSSTFKIFDLPNNWSRSVSAIFEYCVEFELRRHTNNASSQINDYTQRLIMPMSVNRSQLQSGSRIEYNY